jgi:hypothetical protein
MMMKRSLIAHLSDHAARLLAHLRGNRRDMTRVALQTAVAAAAAYLAYGAVGQREHLSWAVIAALFTISVNTDEAVVQGLGRIAGAFLGVGLGFAVGWALPAPVVLSLALATALANMAAAVWPSLRYAAMMAAIVALQPGTEAGQPLATAGAVLFGTLIGVVATLVVWPSFGRHRASETLREALRDCEELLRLVVESVGATDRRMRDAVHGRFLGRLETMHGQLGASYLLPPSLRSGAALREAAVALEGLWHSIVILDRVVGSERHIIAVDAVERLEPDIRAVQEAARRVLSDLGADLDRGPSPEPDVSALTDAVATARETALGLDVGTATGLHALVFALDEIEARTLQLVRVLRPTTRG